MDEIDRNPGLALVTTDVIATQQKNIVSLEQSGHADKLSNFASDERLVPKLFVLHSTYPLRTGQVFFEPKTYGTPYSSPQMLNPKHFGYIGAVKLVRLSSSLSPSNDLYLIAAQKILPFTSERFLARVYFLRDGREYSQLGRLQVETSGQWRLVDRYHLHPSIPIQSGSHILFIEIYEILEEITLGPPTQPHTAPPSPLAPKP